MKAITEDDWENINIYHAAMKTVVEASVIFEGATYCTGSSVIPFLDSIFQQLQKLKNGIRGEHKLYVRMLLGNLKTRFPEGYKDCKPFNCLSLLDMCYGDLYFDEEQKETSIQDIITDQVFDGEAEIVEGEQQTQVASLLTPPPAVTEDGDPVAIRRAQLLAERRRVQTAANQSHPVGSVPLDIRV